MSGDVDPVTGPGGTVDALLAAAWAYQQASDADDPDDKHWAATAIRLEQAAIAYARSVRG